MAVHLGRGLVCERLCGGMRVRISLAIQLLSDHPSTNCSPLGFTGSTVCCMTSKGQEFLPFYMPVTLESQQWRLTGTVSLCTPLSFCSQETPGISGLGGTT